MINVADVRAAMDYATEPEPGSDELGGTFALALHQVAARAACAGLTQKLDSMVTAVLTTPPPHSFAPPPEFHEVRQAITDLDEHVEERRFDDLEETIRAHGGTADSELEQLPDGTIQRRISGCLPEGWSLEDLWRGIGPDRAAAAVDKAAHAAAETAGGPGDARTVRGQSRRDIGLRAHRRKPRWVAATRTVGSVDVGAEIVSGDDRLEVMAAVIDARANLAAGSTIDLYRRTLAGWTLVDTIPARCSCDDNLTGEFAGGEYIRTGDIVVGIVRFDGALWRYGYATDDPRTFRIQNHRVTTRAMAVAELRKQH
ncbi:hypothetical protein P0W64_16480 [Tsukamurella sp. 8F]|uniref:hypothetical protein n=1 Tax=unclassified Tsukamurella TaxID=2633480 RepID=UPI0023BA0228|nr:MULTISPECIES: hypothetical protein [unclassified Tsukamurella]MDF0531132.1 hypothetical protein [Tsukamurella sp. 8J]MDF0588378.1 hypothetical protein [Tsukamurella sp. 8F]